MNIRLRPFRADELDILREIAEDPDFSPLTWVGSPAISRAPLTQ